jgi:hypothetical protein
MFGGFFTPLAILFKLDFSLDFLAVFATPIVGVLACCARQFYELIL